MNNTNKSKEELIAELEMLKAYQKNISFVLDNIKEMFYKLNFDEKGTKTFEFISPQIIDVLGLTPEEYIKNQATISEYFHPDDIEKITNNITKTNNEKKSKILQYRFFNKKINSYVWIEETFFPTYNNKGLLVSIFGSAKDITESKENKIQKEFILENIEEAIYNVKFERKNNTKELVFISPQIKQLTGLTEEEFIQEGKSQKLIKRIHPDDVEEINKNINSLYNEKKNRIYSIFRFKPKRNKNYIWLEETLNAKYDKEGFLTETITVLRNITESKELNDKIKESEKSYKDLLNNSPDLIYILNENAEFVDINTTVTKKLGYTKAELVGKTPAFFSDPSLNNVNSIKKITKNSIKKTQYFDWWIKSKNGKLFLNEIILRKGVYKDKEVLIATAHDITDRIEIQNKIKANEEKLNLVLENIKEGIYSIDFTDKNKRSFSYYNSQLKKLFGNNVEDFATILWEENKKYYHPDDVEKIEKANKQIFTNKDKSTAIEYRFKQKNATNYVWLEEKIFTQFDNQGNIKTNFGIVRDVTQKVISENKLKEKEELYRNLFTNNLAGVFITENDIIIECNNSFANYFGYKSRIELIGKKSEELYFNKIERDDYLKELLKKGFLTNYKLKQIKKDGTIIWVSINVTLTNKKANRIEGTLIDITNQVEKEHIEKENLRLKLVEEANKALQKEIDERKIIAQKLIENQQYTRGIIDCSLDIICAADSKGKIIEYNKSAQNAFGYTKKEINTKNVKHLYAFGDEFISVSKQLKTKGFFIGEISNKKKSGEIFLSFLSASVLKNKEGKIIGTMGVSRNITQEKIAEQKLIDSEEKYRDLFENATDLIQSVTPQGTFIYVNNAWKKALGFTDAELKNFNIFDIIHLEDKNHCQVVFNTLMTSKKEVKVRTSFSFLTKTNKKLTVEGDVSCKIENGKPISTRAIFRDVTEENWRKTQQNVYNNIAKIITQTAEAEVLYEQIRQELGKVINTDVFIVSYALDKNTLTFPYFYDKTEKGRVLMLPRTNKKGINEYFLKQKKSKILYREDLDIILNLNKYQLLGKKAQVFVGVPLKIKNKTIGVLSVQSYTNRNEFSEKTVEILDFISGALALAVQRKYDEQKIYEQSAKLNSIIENSSHLFWTYHKNHGLTSFNKNYYNSFIESYGFAPQENSFNFFNKEKQIKSFWNDKYNAVFEGNKLEFTSEMINQKGNLTIKEIFLSPIINQDGTISEISGMALDITEKKIAEKELKNSLSEKEVLLKEVHHRVKNNLQVITSILSLQSAYINDESTLTILKESQNRIKSMAFIHESLYQTNDFSQINFSEYIVNLSKNLIHSYRINEQLIDLKLDIKPLFLNLDLSIPCGLIINELISNSLKHAFLEKQKGYILITLYLKNNYVYLSVSDNGKGFPKELDFRETESLGLQLVTTLSEQINAEITLQKTKGTIFNIKFKQDQ